MYKNIIYIVCLSSLVFILLLLLRNLRLNKNRANTIFAVTIITTAVWICLLWVADTTVNTGTARQAVNLAVTCVSLLSSLFFLFALNYPEKQSRRSVPLLVLILLINAFFVVQAVQQNIILEVEITTYGAAIVSSSAVYVLHILESYVFIVAGLLVLQRKKRYAKSAERSRIAIMTTGVLVAFIANILSGTLAGYVQGLSWLNFVATASIVFFMGSVAYAILKHKLFDISSFVARSTGYLFTVLSVSMLYSFILLIIGGEIFGFRGGELAQNVFYIVTALIIAFSLPSIKRFFDKLTNKIFYQDAYEPQALLNDLNSMLVTTLDVSTMIRNTSLLVEHYLKSSEVIFFVYKNKEVSEKVFATEEKTTEQLSKIQQLIVRFQEKVTVVDDVQGLGTGLHTDAVTSSISVVVHLDSPSQNKAVGSIVLGPKKSGSMYGKQDYKVLEIIADELVIAIQNALQFEEIQQFNITLQEKVDNATKQLRKANEKLIALDQSKDEFISMASHQLRTPLTSVKGYVSMVVEGDVGKITAAQKKLLDQAYLSSQRMVYLIADLLNVSRLKTGKFVIEAKPTNLADVVETELEQLKEAAASRKLSLEYEKPKEFPVLNLDETKIRQVIMNFADNAIYYTPSGGHIKVAVTDTGKSVEFTVTDDGIGVPKSEQHNLFNKFYRAGNAKKARPDGTGLGLFMAKKVVIAQGGNIIFKTAEGKGSTFGFSFEKKKLTAGTHTVETTDMPLDKPAHKTGTAEAKSAVSKVKKT